MIRHRALGGYLLLVGTHPLCITLMLSFLCVLQRSQETTSFFPQNEPPLIWFQPFSHLTAQCASLNLSSRVSRASASATHKVMFYTTRSKALHVVGGWLYIYMVWRFILYLTVYMSHLTGFQGFRTPWFHPCALKLTDPNPLSDAGWSSFKCPSNQDSGIVLVYFVLSLNSTS